MTNSSPENTTTIGAASPAAAESRQPGRTDLRNTRTSEERQVLALEMIADQLALIHADLCSIDDFSRAGAGSGGPDSGGGEAAQDRWDNEGGSFTDEAALDPDVTRSVEHTTRWAGIATQTCSTR